MLSRPVERLVREACSVVTDSAATIEFVVGFQLCFTMDGGSIQFGYCRVQAVWFFLPAAWLQCDACSTMHLLHYGWGFIALGYCGVQAGWFLSTRGVVAVPCMQYRAFAH